VSDPPMLVSDPPMLVSHPPRLVSDPPMLVSHPPMPVSHPPMPENHFLPSQNGFLPPQSGKIGGEQQPLEAISSSAADFTTPDVQSLSQKALVFPRGHTLAEGRPDLEHEWTRMGTNGFALGYSVALRRSGTRQSSEGGVIEPLMDAHER
jgi:hypothetical protein